MNIKVKDCNDCPFLAFGGWEGEDSECKLDEEGRVLNEEKPFGDVLETPKWCILKENKITVELIYSNEKTTIEIN